MSIGRCFLLLLAAAGAKAHPITFHKEVLPILQRRCQGCHRAGEVAPMPLLTYQDARPWAKSIREAVLTRKMPPWFADARYGKFSNDPTLSQEEIDVIGGWVDGGAVEGNPANASAPLRFVEGWNIGQPELVWEMPNSFQVPAKGVIDYQYVVIPTGLQVDKWVQAAEIRPGNRAVLHHVIVYTRDPGSRWIAGAKPGIPFVPKEGSEGGEPSGGLGGYAPGMVPTILKPGRGILLKAGSDLVLELHYTPNGKPATDKTRIGVIFAKEPPRERVMTMAAGTVSFKIPPRDPNYRVDAALTIPNDVELIDMMPHMHVRGKAFEYRVVYPDGKKETLLRVPRYDFNWQLSYFPEKPIHLSKGTRIEATAWYDNSANNPANPNPNQEVRYGEQTWEEMMFGFFTVAVERYAKQADAPAMERILDKYVEALGGKAALLAPTSLVMKGKVRLPELDAAGTIEFYSKAPNKELVEVASPGAATWRTGFNGVNAWSDEGGSVNDLAVYPKREADFYFPVKMRELFPSWS